MPDTARASAVFLSYAPEDAEVARRLTDALRAFGIEVWAERSGGEAKAREQIGACARFVPVISAATQARSEGDFRREWQLAADRARGLGGVPFILPVIIDATGEKAAVIPQEFRRGRITRLPEGEPTTQFIDLVQHSLTPAKLSGAKIAEHDLGPDRTRVQRRKWLTLTAVAVILIAAGGWWLFTQREAAGAVPVVLLMDTPYADRVYDPATLKAGGSNMNDIADLLQGLPVTVVKEATSATWRREAEVLRLQPTLVVIHRSAFYTFPSDRADELYPLADNKLVAFLGYLAAQSPRTRFIVYSRHSWEVRTVAAKWLADAGVRFPALAGKIETWRVPLDRATFRNPLTAHELRTTVEQTLGLQPKPAAP